MVPLHRHTLPKVLSLIRFNFTVNNGAILYLGTSLLGNGSTGTFTLANGGTLGIGDAGGITASDAIGNIRVTGTRIYNTGANYIYNGTGTQSTGDGLPATVNDLTFSNSGGSVLLNTTHTINNFSITAGSKANLGTFTHLTNSLSLGGIGQPTGTYGHSSSTATNKNDTYFDAASGIVDNRPPEGTWLGATSTDWNTDSNWIGGVPSSETNASISSYPTNQPLISGETTAVANTVTVNSGASLTIDPAGSASFTTLTNSGTLNLKSDADGIASLIINTYTDNNGTENIELFLTGGGDETNYPWHYISSPVATLPVTDVMSSGNDPAANDLAAYYENLVTDNKELAWYGYDGWNYQSDDEYPW